MDVRQVACTQMGTVSRSSHAARVALHRDVGGGMALVAFHVPSVLRDSYVRPGQYTHLTVDGESGYFVLGNPEGQSPWEIVLRGGGGVADRLLAAPVGLEVSATEALGTGFPTKAARGDTVIVLVTAGAIAAARAVVRRRISDGDAAKTRLLVGARAANQLPLESELDTMRTAGVDVRVVLSRSDAPRQYERGYVQHVLSRESTQPSWVFIAGADPMVQEVKATALALGVQPAHVVSNV